MATRQRRVSKTRSIALAVLALQLSAPALRAQEAVTDGQPSVLFVVDTSGSMSGSRIAQAKQAMRSAVESLPINQPLGMRSFGGSCSSGGVRQVAVGIDNRPLLLQRIDSLRASGGTPTPNALRAAVGDLPQDTDGRVIVLISDGQSTCGDPCPVAAELFDSEGIRFTVHTVGFQTAGTAEQQLQCIADATGGTYIPANDAEGLIDAIGDVLDSGLRYNQVQQKSSHNSYLRSEPLLDQLIFHRIRSLELDLQNDGDGPLRAGDWFVHHGDDKSTCTHLSDCLDELRAFDEAVPDHEVVTVFVDLKDDFDTGRRPSDLDATLRSASYLGEDSVFTAADLRQRCSQADDLSESVMGECAWPSLASLRSQFIFVLTGKDDRLDEYLAAGGDAAFIAPEVKDFDAGNARPDVVFYNVKGLKSDLASEIHAGGFVSRAYGINDHRKFQSAISGDVHHIATDEVNYLEAPRFRTHNNLGWPFVALDGPTPLVAEAGRHIRVDVRSGDIDKKQDSFRFDYLFGSDSAQWTSAVSTANSHVEDKAKGCLMARESGSDEAAFFAICRFADGNRLHMLYRETTGGDVTSIAAPDLLPSSTEDDQQVFSFIRLVLVPGPGGQCATAYGGLSIAGRAGSADPGLQRIGSRCFAAPLPLQGLASASKKDKERVSFIYTGLTRDGQAIRAEDLSGVNVGDTIEAATYDGVSPGANGECVNSVRSAPEPFGNGLMVEEVDAALQTPTTMRLSWTPSRILCGEWIVARGDPDAVDRVKRDGQRNEAPNEWWFELVEIIGRTEQTFLDVSVFDYADGEEVCFAPILMDDEGFVGSYRPVSEFCYLNSWPEPLPPPDVAGPTRCTVRGAGGWTMGANVTWDDGLVINNVRLGPRLMATRLSVPYIEVDYRMTDTQQLFGTGDPFNVRARIELGEDRTQRQIAGTRVIPRMQRIRPLTCDVDGEEIRISTAYRIESAGDASGGGALLERTVEQSYRFRIDQYVAGDICEPSEVNVPCYRWWPQFTYTNPSNSTVPVNFVRAVQRFDFTVDGVTANVMEILDATKGGLFTGQPEKKLLKDKEAVFRAIPGFVGPEAPEPENLHQTSRDKVTLPGVLGVLPGVAQTPGCAECVHIHWKWPNLVDVGFGDFTDGHPHVPDGSNQSLSVGVSIDKRSELDPMDVFEVFNGEKSIDGADLVSWFVYESDGVEDQFWPVDPLERHGGSGAAFFTPAEWFTDLFVDIGPAVETETGTWEVQATLDIAAPCKFAQKALEDANHWKGPFYMLVVGAVAELADADPAFKAVPLGTPFRKLLTPDGLVIRSLQCKDLPLTQTLKFAADPGVFGIDLLRAPLVYRGDPYVPAN